MIENLEEQNDFQQSQALNEATSFLGNLLLRLKSNTERKEWDKDEFNDIDGAIGHISQHILNLLHAQRTLGTETQRNLLEILHGIPAYSMEFLKDNTHFQHLKFMFFTSPQTRSSNRKNIGVLPSFDEVLGQILAAHPEQLIENGTSYYKIASQDNNKFAVSSDKETTSKIHHTAYVIELLQSQSTLHMEPFQAQVQVQAHAQGQMPGQLQGQMICDFKKSFVMEWLFEKALVEAVFKENTTLTFVNTIQNVVRNQRSDFPILKGLFAALQKDFFTLYSHPLQRNNQFKFSPLEKGMQLAHNVFPVLVSLERDDLNAVYKEVVCWAIELPIYNEELRFFQRIHWRWIRFLATSHWDANLRKPPSWVVQNAGTYSGIIFHGAHASWLQKYGSVLLEKIYCETLVENFSPVDEHYNYVEFLARCMRKKCPVFANKHESLYALHLLGRTTRQEALQYASVEAKLKTQLVNDQRIQSQDVLEFNAVTRALALLYQISNESSQLEVGDLNYVNT